MQEIITFTPNPTLDISSSVDTVMPEIKLRCQAPSYDPGGGGINVSRAIHQLGGEAHAWFFTGGCLGEMLQRLVSQSGIPYTALPIQGITRQSFTILETTTLLQYRFNQPGPVLQPEEWRACLEKIQALAPAPAYFIASSSLPPGLPVDFLAQVSALLQPYKTRVVIDTSGEALVKALEAGCYLIKPNLRELEQLAGSPLPTAEQQVTFAQDLMQRHPIEVILISLGEEGARYVTPTTTEQIQAPKVPINSKVGAGDSMVAGTILALAKGWPLGEAVRYGVAAGTAAVMTPGTQLCRLEDTERLYQEIKASDYATLQTATQTPG